jgi:exopolyphosphatase / guanosine-5'-triphosphate,3'-diphosphate pyrophosphatase
MRAGIDIGTNSVRLLVLDDQGGELARTATVTGLGRGLSDGLLDSESVVRTVKGVADALAVAASVGVVLGPHNTRITATSAARDARNGDALFLPIVELCGVRPEVLSGSDEGALAWAGAMSSLPPRLPEEGTGLDALVDIGGGSTEFVVGSAAGVGGAAGAGGEVRGVISLDVGCVRMTERYLRSDPPTPVELSSLISVVRAHLEDVQREMPLIDDATRLVGVAGSIVTVAAVELGRFDRQELHGMWLSRSAAEDVFRTLALESAADRAFNPGLHPDRVGTIVAGSAILVAVLRHFDLPGIRVSTSDLLDALAASAPNS